MLFNELTSNSLNLKFLFYSCPESTWRPAAPNPEGQFYFFLQIYKEHPNISSFCLTNIPLTVQLREVWFLPVQSLQDQNLEVDFNFFLQLCYVNPKICIFFFVSCPLTLQIRNLNFLPVQSGHGGLQDQNLEADFNFFFRYVNSIQKDAYSVLLVGL